MTFRTILGIRYFDGTRQELLLEIRKGGLIVVPAAPALAELGENQDYRQAVEGATFAISDSSYMVLLWFLRSGEFLHRISGLQFLRTLVGDPVFRQKDASLWVMPSKEDQDCNLAWLNGQGIPVTPDHCYLAPKYTKGAVTDKALLALIETHRPKYVVINIGGGTQEILGYFLHSHLSYRPAIICTGAAVAFLSGRQASIHPVVDKMMLAWLARCFDEPKRFIPRYLRALRLFWVLMRYADRSVPATGLSGSSRR